MRTKVAVMAERVKQIDAPGETATAGNLRGNAYE